MSYPSTNKYTASILKDHFADGVSVLQHQVLHVGLIHPNLSGVGDMSVQKSRALFVEEVFGVVTASEEQESL